jgi:hypothetical protein
MTRGWIDTLPPAVANMQMWWLGMDMQAEMTALLFPQKVWRGKSKLCGQYSRATD